MRKADPPVIIGIRPDISQMNDIIHLPDPALSGKFKDFELDLMAADIDRAEKICHVFPLFQDNALSFRTRLQVPYTCLKTGHKQPVKTPVFTGCQEQFLTFSAENSLR